MKRITLLVFSLLLAVALQAQTAMKVAILEPVNKANDVPYAVKQMVRSSFTAAISSTPGFEGYDRVNMNAIFNEQEFQRTGNVSDDQIRQIGVATGAAYVLVTEVSKYDDKNIVITATILDVETFGVKKSKWEVCGTSVKDLKQTCETLARQVLMSEETTVAPVKKIKNSSSKDVKYRNPWASFGLSLLFPGLGQYYNHEKTKARIFLAVGIASSIAFSAMMKNDSLVDEQWPLIPLFVYGTVWIWSMIDAPKSSNRINESNGFAQLEIGDRATLTFAPSLNFYNQPTASRSLGVAPGVGMMLLF